MASVRALTLLVSLVAACTDDKPIGGSARDACSPSPDGGCGRRTDPDPRLADLARSAGVWDELVTAMGDTYWYEEENCLVNATEHEVTLVQVENGRARLLETRTIATSECLGLVNRYADFEPRTVPVLYQECRSLLRREGSDATFEVDDRGVIRACTWPGAPDCADNCGEGVILRSLEFEAHVR